MSRIALAQSVYDDAERHAFVREHLTPEAPAVRAKRLERHARAAVAELHDARGLVDTSLDATLERLIARAEDFKRAAKRLRRSQSMAAQVDAKQALFALVDNYHALRGAKGGA